MAVRRMTSSPILMGVTAALVLAAALMAAKLLSVEALLAIMALGASIMVIVFPVARTISYLDRYSWQFFYSSFLFCSFDSAIEVFHASFFIVLLGIPVGGCFGVEKIRINWARHMPDEI